MEQAKRLIKIVKEDKNSYTMQEVFDSFVLSFDGYQRNSRNCRG